MVTGVFDVISLIKLLGVNRMDRNLSIFLEGIEITPLITVDKDDGADDEYIEFKELGFNFYFEHDILDSIFLFSADNDEEYLEYACSLPDGLTFNQSKQEVLNLLGHPFSEGGGDDEFFGKIPGWVKYKKDNYYLHIEFSEHRNKIRMVSLSEQTKTEY